MNDTKLGEILAGLVVGIGSGYALYRYFMVDGDERSYFGDEFLAWLVCAGVIVGLVAAWDGLHALAKRNTPRPTSTERGVRRDAVLPPAETTVDQVLGNFEAVGRAGGTDTFRAQQFVEPVRPTRGRGQSRPRVVPARRVAAAIAREDSRRTPLLSRARLT